MLLICSGSVETNPGPNSSVRNQISFCSWNIDSLLARDSSKISSIEGLQAVHNFDIFGICESYLTDKVKQQDLKINIFLQPLFAQIAEKLLHGHAEGFACIIKNIYLLLTALI